MRNERKGLFLSISEQDSGGVPAEVRAFFVRAEQVAATDNFDYAIDMFMEGLRRAPDAVAPGHKPLHHMALIRQGKGGKKPSITEKLKYSRGKTPLEHMLNAEYLFAKDPDNLHYAATMMKSAAQAGYKNATEWIADLLFAAHHASDKPSAQAILAAKEAYASVGLFEKALAALQFAVNLRPDDGELKDELRDLSAQLTVQKGRYGQEGDFRDSIKDRAEQEKLQQQEKIVKTKDYRLAAVAEARAKFAQNSDLAINIFQLADTLAELAEEGPENEAIELLDRTYSKTNDFSFKRYSGRIRLKQLHRWLRAAQAQLEKEPQNTDAKAKLAATTSKLKEFELEHLRLCVDNYPTDLRAKFELGLAFMQNEQYDEAIVMFQEARQDPRNMVAALDKMGLCFFMKGWLQDAVDIFTEAIEAHEIEGDALGKQLRYNLGRAYEQLGNLAEALELYRKIAQVDYAYKDVRQRVDRLRKPGGQPTSES